MINIKSILRRIAAKCNRSVFQEWASLRLRIKEPVPDEQVVLLVEEVLVEVANFVFHFLVEGIRLRRVDSDRNEAVLVTVWILIVECVGCNTYTYLC